MKSKGFHRRGFLKRGAALVGAAAAGMQRPGVHAQGESGTRLITDASVRPMGEISRFERKIVRRGTSTVGLTPLQDLHGIITPTGLHFYQSHENGITPDIDPKQHRLLIHGMVDRPVELTMDDIKRLPPVSRICFIECNGNTLSYYDKRSQTVQDIHGRVSCAEWTGVSLSLLLKEVGIQRGAEWLIAVAADPGKHAHSVPIAKAMDDGMLAYAMNGEPLRIENGYPLRLLLPGWNGRINVKWLNRIKVVDQPYALSQEIAAFMPHGPAGMFTYEFAGAKAFTYHHETPPKSVITFPSGGQRLPKPGTYEISGLAWAGAGAIRKVEVSVDDGKTWKVAKLQEPVLPRAFTRFYLPWTWDGSDVILQSRSTDETGEIQPTPEQAGWSARAQSPGKVTFWGKDDSEACRSFLGDELCAKLPRRVGMAVIQSWKVNKDGKVENAMPAIAESHGIPVMRDADPLMSAEPEEHEH